MDGFWADKKVVIYLKLVRFSVSYIKPVFRRPKNEISNLIETRKVQ
jgi:hypothetical protein